MNRIYIVRLKREDGLSIVKFGITSTTIEERLKRTYLPKYGNGVPMFEYFNYYTPLYDSGLVFSKDQAEQIELKLKSHKKRDFYTPYGDAGNLDGITEMRYYNDDLVEQYKMIIEDMKNGIRVA